jgi:hypothetical protein
MAINQAVALAIIRRARQQQSRRIKYWAAEFGPFRSPKPEDGDHRTRAWRSPKPGIPITETGDGDRLTSVVRPMPDLR